MAASTAAEAWLSGRAACKYAQQWEQMVQCTALVGRESVQKRLKASRIGVMPGTTQPVVQQRLLSRARGLRVWWSRWRASHSHSSRVTQPTRAKRIMGGPVVQVQ
jgi:hypothetical protein